MAKINMPQKYKESRSLLNELQSYGFKIDSLGSEDIVNRCNSDSNGKLKKDAGWYVYYETPFGTFARYGDWRIGKCEIFENVTGEPENVGYYRKELQSKYEEAEKLKHAVASDEAKKIIDSCESAKNCDHPYLKNKCIKNPESILLKDGRIVIPVMNKDGEITTLQHIDENGYKKYLTGGRVKGCFSLVGIDYQSLKDVNTIAITEGFATAKTLNEHLSIPVVMAQSCGNIETVCDYIASLSNIKSIIIYADNDHMTDGNPGLTCANKAWEKHKDKASVKFPKGIKGTDFNDLFIEKGLEELKNQCGLNKKEKIFHDIGDIEFKPTDWLIEGLLEKNSLSCIFGDPGHGKTHIALSMAMSCAAQKSWFGKEVNCTGTILYLCGEDMRGAHSRLFAIAEDIGVKDMKTGLNFKMSHNPLHMLDLSRVKELDEEISQYEKVEMIIIDTLNKNFGNGDENDTGDMTQFVTALNNFRIKYGCHIMVLHHVSKANPKLPRGSIVLSGDVNTLFRVNKSENHFENKKDKFVVNMFCTKQKNGMEFPDEAYTFAIREHLYYDSVFLKLLHPMTLAITGKDEIGTHNHYKELVKELIEIKEFNGEEINIERLKGISSKIGADEDWTAKYVKRMIKKGVLGLSPVINNFIIK